MEIMECGSTSQSPEGAEVTVQYNEVRHRLVVPPGLPGRLLDLGLRRPSLIGTFLMALAVEINEGPEGAREKPCRDYRVSSLTYMYSVRNWGEQIPLIPTRCCKGETERASISGEFGGRPRTREP